MNFDLNDDQRVLEETILRYFARAFPPSLVREVFEGDSGLSGVLWTDMGQLGLFGVMVPGEYGGLGLELLDLALAAECLGYSAAPGPFLDNVLATLAIALGGDERQRSQWLPALADGSKRATLALAEEDDRWLPEEACLEGGESLTGTKRWVLYPFNADLIVVSTSSGFSVAEFPTAATVQIEPTEVLDRTRRVAHIQFIQCPAEPLVNGLAVAPRVRDAALVLLAADASGGARRCLEDMVAYANTREQFGVTIGHFQALKHQLADVALEVEQLRSLYWYSAHAFDHVPEDASKYAALAKAHATERYVDAGRRAIEVYGGVGYTWAHHGHIYLKRAIFDRTYLGRPAFHRERVAVMNGWHATS